MSELAHDDDTDDRYDPSLAKGTPLTWLDIEQAAQALADRHRDHPIVGIYGVPTGGAPVAVMVSRMLRLPLLEQPVPGALVVDDLVDTGRTLVQYAENGYAVDALFRKPWSPQAIAPRAVLRRTWLRFPWEREDGAPVDAVIRLLQFLGEDPTRDGLLATPARVIRALSEMTSGYGADVAAILNVTFEMPVERPGKRGAITVRRLPFSSMCEHHMLPFTGHATIGYVPADNRVVGLSKLARLLDAFAHRLQVQERLTDQIVDALVEHLAPAGAFAVVDAHHTCMSLRGVRKHGEMLTSSFRGVCEQPEFEPMALAMHRPTVA